ncbi:MAG: hypothetical protein ACOZE7_21255 [Pseudomonadota bacterium]
MKQNNNPRYKMAHLGYFCVSLLLSVPAHAFADIFSRNMVSACPAPVFIAKGAEDSVSVNSLSIYRRIEPSFFGFNIELMEFQMGFQNESRDLMPELIDWMRPFSGAVYRYPGGTGNYVDWRDTVGPIKERKRKKYATWMPPKVATFGFDEYRKFLKDVEGVGWYLVNIQGTVDSEEPIEGLVKGANAAAKYLSSSDQKGLPTIGFWELGNELDRHPFTWPPDKIADRATKAAQALKSGGVVNPRFVMLFQEYPAQQKRGISAKKFNQELFKGLKPLNVDLGFHLYYDAVPGGLSMPEYLNRACQGISDVAEVNDGKRPTAWITEHARVPEGAFDKPDWKDLWPQTANLQAAIGVADFYIAAASVPEIAGAFVHTLQAMGGPWPMFHKNSSGSLKPSAVYWAVRMLRDSYLSNVLQTKSISSNESDYRGGYDVRSVVLTDDKKEIFSFWAINRDKRLERLNLKIPALKGRNFVATRQNLTAGSLKSSSYDEASYIRPSEVSVDINFDASGEAVITLPGWSISTFKLIPKERTK